MIILKLQEEFLEVQGVMKCQDENLKFITRYPVHKREYFEFYIQNQYNSIFDHKFKSKSNLKFNEMICDLNFNFK